MPHSISSAELSGSRSSTPSPSPSSILTAATSVSSTSSRLVPANYKRPVIKPRKPRPKSQPGDWGQLLGIPVDTTPGGSNTSSRVSSLHTNDSYADLLSQASSQAHASSPTGAMGGNRTSANMNGALDAQRRATSYEEQYQYKDNAHGAARERVHRESPVIAELRTNVIIKDEFTLVTDMSYHLAARYTRPDSSIMINVDHSSCLALGGTFDPCYILTLSCVPSQMQATTNKRNAALIQSFMADILSVPPERGIIKFVPIPEENFACNGNTLFGEIERLEQQQVGSNSGVKRAMTDVRKSMPAFKSKNSIPKFDTDFAKKVDQADGFDGHVEELRNGVVPAPLKPKSEASHVFEAARPRVDDARPSTSHGTPSTPAAMDGLRLNGIAKGDLEGPGSKTPFGRPKTVAGRPDHPSSEIHSLPRRGSDEGAPAPIVKSDSSRKHKSSKSENVTRSTMPAHSSTPPPMASPTERTKPAYLDNLPKSILSPSRSRSKSQSPPHALPQEPANTAKRRTTAANSTNAPKKVPQPPPVPETKQAKVSKRKSFLAAFKR